MKTLHSLRDLEHFGFNALTGEACRVGRRILVDLTTQRACQIWRDLLGMPWDSPLSPGWNSKGLASVMLSRGLIEELMAWCLISDGADEVWLIEGGSAQGVSWRTEVIGIYDADDLAQAETVYCGEYSQSIGRSPVRIHLKTSQPGSGTRCEHQMSGRIS